MTMSHIIRRTKKCCLKLIRKLSFSNAGTTTTNSSADRIHNIMRNNKGSCYPETHTAKYMKHENSVTPSHHRNHHHHHNHHRQNSNSPYNSVLDLNLDELNGNENEAKNLNKKRLNLRKRLNKNYKNQCYEKINQSAKSSSSSPANRHNDNSNNTNANNNNKGNWDEKIVFTENKIYIGLNANNLLPSTAAITSSSSSFPTTTTAAPSSPPPTSSNHNRRKIKNKIEKPLFNGLGLGAPHAQSTGSLAATTMSLSKRGDNFIGTSTSSSNSNNNNNGHLNNANVNVCSTKPLKFCDKYRKKLQFIVTEPTDSEFDINGNPIMMTTSASALEPFATAASCGGGTATSTTTRTSATTGTAKFNNKSNHELRRTYSSDQCDVKLNEIIFEKVKYDKNKKYLHDSPSTSSNLSKNSLNLLDNHFLMNQQAAAAKTSSTIPISDYDNLSWDHIDNSINYYAYNSGEGEDCDEDINQMNYDKLYDPKTASSINYYNPWGSSEDNSGCTDDFHYRPSYWDLIKRSTANTLRLNYEGSTDVWDNLQNRNYEIDADAIRTGNNTTSNSGCWSSSRRTSISTVETWVEDEVFDNSFNEELERRCASFKI